MGQQSCLVLTGKNEREGKEGKSSPSFCTSPLVPSQIDFLDGVHCSQPRRTTLPTQTSKHANRTHKHTRNNALNRTGQIKTADTCSPTLTPFILVHTGQPKCERYKKRGVCMSVLFFLFYPFERESIDATMQLPTWQRNWQG